MNDPLQDMLDDFGRMLDPYLLTPKDKASHRLQLCYLYHGDMGRVQEVAECMARFERTFGKGE
jgi:hypothetical protein